MTVRLHIDRVVVDRSLLGRTDPRDVGPALEAHLGRLLAAGATHSQGEAFRSAESPLALRRQGTLAERLATTLYDGVPALRALRRSGR
ncbi:MAG TPA: hypothetical protein VF079_01785 [Sphingomicrobium sp.]